LIQVFCMRKAASTVRSRLNSKIEPFLNTAAVDLLPPDRAGVDASRQHL